VVPWGRVAAGPMRPLHEHLAGRLLQKLTDALLRHPRWFVFPQILLAVACIVYTSTHLRFSTNRNDLVSSNEKHQIAFREFSEEFKSFDSLVAIAESDSTEKNRQFVERLAARLRAEPDLFKDIYYKGDLKQMGSKALFFLPEATLVDLRQSLQTNRPLIETFSRINNLDGLFQTVNRQFRSAPGTFSRARVEDDGSVRPLPTLQRVVDLAAASVNSPSAMVLPGIAALFTDEGGADPQGLYLTFAGGRIYLVTAQPVTEQREEAAIERLRVLVEETRHQVPGVNAGITGEAVLKVDEMRQARHDTDVAAVISLALSALIFIYGYREIRRPLLATFTLLIGVAYTLGFATLAIGQLNILSISLVPILIGLAIDFSVHLIARFEEELRRGDAKERAVRKALAFTGVGIFSSGFTTAGAFFAMMLTDFKGIRDMGLISGVGLLVCLIPMMTVLPVLLLWNQPGTRDTLPLAARPSVRQRVEESYMKRPVLVLLGGLLFTLFTVSQFHKLNFDYNLLNLQTRDLPAVGIEKKLIASGSQSLLYGVVVAHSLPEALELEQQLRRLPVVANVVSMAHYLNEGGARKQQIIHEIKREVGAIHLAEPATEPVDIPRLNQALYSLQGYLGLGADLLRRDGADPKLEEQLRSLRVSVNRLQNSLTAGHPQVTARITAFQQGLFKDLQETVAIIRQQDDSGPLTVGDLPPFLRDRFLSRSGKFMLQVYPRGDVWQRAQQEEFVRSVRTVAPNVTGSPVQFYEYTSMLKESFQKAAGYAAAVIAFLVYLHFRRLDAVVLAFLPVGLGFCWMLGLMGLFGVPFNPVNIIALTLVIGIGVTNGIHILNRFAEEAHPSILARSTGKAVLVSALTTMAGFGSLMVAKHQGIASLGAVMLLGTSMCMIASLAFLPAVLTLLNIVGWSLVRKRRSLRDWFRRPAVQA
jgi:hopanoid biosynthesis associated RND transporter like protein HpnN